ncbi:hypothetical protein CHARACLAT_032833 [Characodon lateralis]|uniref:Uncharacterized protein n=1 Tax=Characodon lateralis TaxID=208331 RepID=A0ABU7DLX5_9TELE|nr:hypothetical protein [Characodon lateralis]
MRWKVVSTLHLIVPTGVTFQKIRSVALISKYVTKGWKEVQGAYADKENSEEVVKVLSYLEVVEKVKHSRDETEVSSLIEEHKLEREQLLTDHLRSKQVIWVSFIILH